MKTKSASALEACAEHGAPGMLILTDDSDSESIFTRFAETDIAFDAPAAHLQSQRKICRIQSWFEPIAVIVSNSNAYPRTIPSTKNKENRQ